MTMEQQTKTCTKCGKQKLLSEFSKAKDRPLGRTSQCKQCKKDWYLTDYQNNPEKYAMRSIRWKESHQDHVRLIRKNYEKSPVRKAYLAREDVKQRIKQNHDQFLLRNPECASRYMRKYRQRHDDGRFARYRNKYRANLGTGYINELCYQGTGWSAKDVPPVMTSTKRDQLKIHRATNQLKKLLKEI